MQAKKIRKYMYNKRNSVFLRNWSMCKTTTGFHKNVYL